MKAACNVLFVILSIFFASGSDAGEGQARSQIADHAASLFLQDEFAELERIAEEYRSTEARTGSGIWKLSVFYAGIGDATERVRDGKSQAWGDLEAKALRWIALYPGSATPHIVYARILIDHGWDFRGTGYAREVKPENWKPFYEYLDKARQYLEEHRQFATVDPVWYDTMLLIAKAQGWDKGDFRRLVDEATSHFPYFYEIYFKAIQYLLPKWHGDRFEIERFADYAVQRTHRREGMGLYARVYWYASQSYYGSNLVGSNVDWEKMKRGMDDVLRHYPDQWNINSFAFLACMYGDKPKTVELMRLVQLAVPKAWASYPDAYRKCRLWSASNAKHFESDSVLTAWLSGQWAVVRVVSGEEVHEQNIILKRDGSIATLGTRHLLTTKQTTAFRWQGKWGVKEGTFWYEITSSDLPDFYPIGPGSEFRIGAITTELLVLIDESTGRKFEARRKKD